MAMSMACHLSLCLPSAHSQVCYNCHWNWSHTWHLPDPEYSGEGLMLNLKLQYVGHLMRSADSLEKTLTLGKTEQEGRGQQGMIRLDGIPDSMDMSLSKFWEVVKDREAWGSAVYGVAKSQTWQQLNNRALDNTNIGRQSKEEKCWLKYCRHKNHSSEHIHVNLRNF